MKRVAVFFILIVLSGCSDLEKPKQLERADAILSKLNTLDAKLAEFQLNDAEELIAGHETLMSQLKELEQDTISVEEAEKMNEFVRLQETIPIALELETQIRTSIDGMRKNVEKLRKDISNGDGRRDQYNLFLAKEKEKLVKIERKTNTCAAMLKDIEDHWTTSLLDMELIIAEQKVGKEAH